MPADTFLSLLTPPGRGALATIEVRGPAAWRYAQACLDRPIRQSASDPIRPWLRGFRGQQGAAEELVVSFPAEDVARIHCHGGPAACENILQALVKQGAQRVAWQQLADPWRIAISAALTERTALILLQQTPAAWEAKIRSLLKTLDGDRSLVGEQLDELLARAPLGLHLAEPWRVVIAGRPNAGKSSLLNALLGYQRSITHDEPGTTRDVVTARTAFDGWPVELRDTAGLRATDDELEAAGVALAEAEIDSADLVLQVVPANEAKFDDQLTRREELVVRSKCDLTPESACNGMCVSAKTSAGLPDLIAAIAQRLVGDPPAPGALVPFHPMLVIGLKQARAALVTGELGRARAEFQALLKTPASPCDSSGPAHPSGAGS